MSLEYKYFYTAKWSCGPTFLALKYDMACEVGSGYSAHICDGGNGAVLNFRQEVYTSEGLLKDNFNVIGDLDIPSSFFKRLKDTGFYTDYDNIRISSKECPKSPDGKHVKGKTPLLGKHDNEFHSICRYCGKELD